MDGYPQPIYGGYPPMMPPYGALQPRLHQIQTLSMESLGSYSDYEDPNRAMLPPQNPHSRSRRRQPAGSEHVKHRRTRSGCYTCRQRRVKCDETHPICDRCRKGKRECTYPGTASSSAPASGGRSSRSGSKVKGSSPGSTPSGSDGEFDEKVPLDAILDEDEDEGFNDSEPPSATSQTRKPSDTSSLSPSMDTSASTIPRNLKRPQPTRTSSKQSIKSEVSQSGHWASLPKDVRHYLNYHRQSMGYHHYAFKYDGGDFLKTTFLEIAMNDGSTSLLYAIVAFAAYHHSVSTNDDDISIFLSYYNKSIAHLQQSLKNKRHNVATLLTILQLATIEEFLGDWVNLMGHQKAALQILTDLFTPQTIMQDETRRKIVNWYIRFDLFASIMSGGETTLSREWFVAAADFYKRQAKDRPNDLGARFEEYFATSRLLAIDVSLLLAAKTSNNISNESFSAGVQNLTAEFAEFGHTVESAFTDPSCFVKSFPRAPPAGNDEIINYRDPNFLYAGELSTMNFVLLDHWAIDLMFKFQIAIATGQTPSRELAEIAIKKCKMFEAIQYGEESGPTAVLGCQASLGIIPLFLPNDGRHVMWCRRKLADIERLGYIYPATLREQMSKQWQEDVSKWWLPDGMDFPSTIRTIREFVEYRATRPTDAWTDRLRDMSGIFKSMELDDAKSSGGESSASPWRHGEGADRPFT